MSRKKRNGKIRGTATTPGALALRALLHMYRWGLEDLAEQLGVHYTTAGRWFYGARPNRQTAERMAMRWPQHISIGLWGYQ